MSVIGRIVGRLHVGTSDREVVEYVFSRFKQDWLEQQDAATLGDIAHEALAEHRRNGDLYDSLYGGGMADLEKEITERLYGGAENRELMERGGL